MKILVINNYTKYIDDLLHFLKGHEAVVTSPERIKDINVDEYQRIILTGGGIFAFHRNISLFEDEINIIKNCKIPLLGICLGSELIAVAFGGQIKRREKRIKGSITLSLKSNDPLFENIREIEIYQNHIWEITELSENLVPLLHNDGIIEAFRHKERSIYGLQFHPEVNSSSQRLLTNFLTDSLLIY